MALQEITCPDCDGAKGGDCGQWGCLYGEAGECVCGRCWGTGVIEVQRGTTTAREVSDLANLRSDGAILARWEADRERQG